MPYSRLAEAVALVNAARYRLGASVFGPATEARAVAGVLDVGTVLVNDIVVPTADPRLPFGGSGASGYGTTRGREGLLGMTRPRVTVVRTGRRRPHFARLLPAHAPIIAALLRLLYGDAATRWRALCSIPAAVRALTARTAGRYAITTGGEQA
jgi:delta 1-pyrroline-5-carboxylate dehydrogenase